jgi:hypothetical protein
MDFGSDGSIAGILGRPDLSSNYGAYMAAPVAGAGSGIVNGSSGISGNVSVGGSVATGQASLSLAAAMVVLFGILYFTTRGHQH